MSRILLVDGSTDDRDRTRDRLRAAGHDVSCVGDATAAVERIEQHSFDMIVTDWMLRDMSGLELAHYARRHANGRQARVIIHTARNDPVAVAQALDGGIEDYMVKPLEPAELIARVNAALRRPAALPVESVLEVGPIRLDKLGHKVTVGSGELDLAPVEFRLMAYFMENRGRVLARRHLLENVWKRRSGIGERTVDVHVRRLRAALEPHACADLLQTVRGFGYRFG